MNGFAAHKLWYMYYACMLYSTSNFILHPIVSFSNSSKSLSTAVSLILTNQSTRI